MDDNFDTRRLIFPGLAGLYERFAPLSYALMRFSAGAVLFPPRRTEGVLRTAYPALCRHNRQSRAADALLSCTLHSLRRVGRRRLPRDRPLHARRGRDDLDRDDGDHHSCSNGNSAISGPPAGLNMRCYGGSCASPSSSAEAVAIRSTTSSARNFSHRSKGTLEPFAGPSRLNRIYVGYQRVWAVPGIGLITQRKALPHPAPTDRRVGWEADIPRCSWSREFEAHPGPAERKIRRRWPPAIRSSCGSKRGPHRPGRAAPVHPDPAIGSLAQRRFRTIPLVSPQPVNHRRPAAF